MNSAVFKINKLESDKDIHNCKPKYMYYIVIEYRHFECE